VLVLGAGVAGIRVCFPDALRIVCDLGDAVNSGHGLIISLCKELSRGITCWLPVQKIVLCQIPSKRINDEISQRALWQRFQG
jgi:hypothetical protein